MTKVPNEPDAVNPAVTLRFAINDQRRRVTDLERWAEDMLRPLAHTFICLALTGCLRTDCVNEVREQLGSPDGKLEIVVFSRDCGATTGFNTQASILGTKQKLPDAGGNVFVLDNGSAKVSWQKDGSILVVLGHGVRSFKKETLVSGVAIEYREE